VLQWLASGYVSFCLLFLSTACNAIGTQSTPLAVTKRNPQGQIKHIIFFIKENRTFDNYFGTYPGANGATTALDSAGQVVPLRHEADQIPDINHASQYARAAYDNGKMDHFDQTPASKPLNGGSPAPAPYTNNSLTQLYQSDIPDYWKYAQNFVLGDNMFSSLMGRASPITSIPLLPNPVASSIIHLPTKMLAR
jgi:phospholipase C